MKQKQLNRELYHFLNLDSFFYVRSTCEFKLQNCIIAPSWAPTSECTINILYKIHWNIPYVLYQYHSLSAPQEKRKACASQHGEIAPPLNERTSTNQFSEANSVYRQLLYIQQLHVLYMATPPKLMALQDLSQPEKILCSISCTYSIKFNCKSRGNCGSEAKVKFYTHQEQLHS